MKNLKLCIVSLLMVINLSILPCSTLYQTAFQADAHSIVTPYLIFPEHEDK